MKSWGQEKIGRKEKEHLKTNKNKVHQKNEGELRLRKRLQQNKQNRQIAPSRSLNRICSFFFFFLSPPILLLIGPFQFWDRSSLSLRERAAADLHSCVPHCGESIKPQNLSSKAPCSLSDRWRAVSLVLVGKQRASKREWAWAIARRVSETISWADTWVQVTGLNLSSTGSFLPHMCGVGCVHRVHYRFRLMNFKNVAFHAPRSILEVRA